ncbi:MAG TPA: NAD(P)-dependent oxidoreductase [Acidobacteriaceae bacterium]|nr:NAD(P)-dependent oxidoreductase [Acidobacteriaceae bacterium]
MRIAFLGIGKMGVAIARHLIKAGHELTVWNRTRASAEVLGKEGARVAETAAEAVQDAEVVFTMVMDDAALEAVLFDGRALKGMMPGAVHVSLSTISVALSDRLTLMHRAEHSQFVGAPVFGRPNVAEAARLATVAAGEREAVEKVKPLLETFSRSVTVVSEKPSAAHALKLGGNFLITAMIASLSESMVFAEALGIEPRLFAETVNAALFQSPFYDTYRKLILNPPMPPGGTVALGEKDVRLFREAAEGAKVKTPLADEFKAHFDRAIAEGMRDADWAGGYYRLAKQEMLS